MVGKFDLQKGQVQYIGRKRDKSLRNDISIAMIPDGKHFLAGPNIIDRKTLDTKRSKEIQLRKLSFSQNRERYCGVYKEMERLAWGSTPIDTLIVVCESRTIKPIFAFRIGLQRYVDVKMSPDGKKIAVRNANNTVEIWNLP